MYREGSGYQNAEGQGEVSEIGEGNKEVQISSYKINQSQRSNVQHQEYSQ